MTDEAWTRQHVIFERMVRALIDCPVPIIGAVNGAAYGGGCEIAGCCDFLYAADTARFALTEVTLGIMPGGGGTQTLPRAVGERRAKELILTGKPFTSAQARDWGFVNEVFPLSDLMREALATASRIARNAPISVRQAKPRSIAACNRHCAMGWRWRRGLKLHGSDRGPPRRRAGLQREASAQPGR
jgi:enoyl-CoA hydratase/carnithine racemase